jgi:hypothetical protein
MKVSATKQPFLPQTGPWDRSPSITSDRPQDDPTRRYFAAAMDDTVMVSPLSVPVTVTFCPAKARGLV